MPIKFLKPSDRPLPPAWIIIFFILLSLAVLIFHLPEKITATLGLFFFFLLTALHPINGIWFMVLSIPFFLGAPHNPYFSLFEILVYGTLLLGFFRLWREKRSVEIPFKPLVLLLLVAALFSIPLNAKEYYWEFWAATAGDIWFQWMRGHEKFPLIHLRALSNFISGILIFILAANLFSKTNADDWNKLFKGMVWMAVLICALGIFYLFKIIPFQPKTYLSLSLAGTHEGAISALSFNRQYLAQYLLLLFPMVFYFLFLYRRNLSGLIPYGLFLGLFIFSLSASMQRSAFSVLFLELILLLGFLARYMATNKKKSLYFFLIPLLLLAVMFLADFLFLKSRFISRILLLGFSEPDQRRFHLWNTAWNMFQHSPFLGVGLGKYFEFFPEFFSDPRLGWRTFARVRGEPHSFFFQTLAEQGAFGLILILALVGIVLMRLIKKAKEKPDSDLKILSGVLAVSLISWLMLGFFHNVAYVRSLGLFFWVLLGWSAALTAPHWGSVMNRLQTKFFLLGLLVLTAALGYQIKLIYDHPPNPFFRAGFHEPETLPGGEKIRWAGKRAVINLDVQGGKKAIWVSAPLPGIDHHPQKVRFRVGEKWQEMILRDPGWHQVTLSNEKPFQERILLRIEADHTFNPRKAGISNDERDLGIMIREE